MENNTNQNFVAAPLLQELEEAAKVKPVTTIGGNPVYTFQDALKLNVAEIKAGKMGYKETDLVIRELNPSGDTYPCTKKKNAAIDPTTYFDNRYRKTKTKQPGKASSMYEIVTDWRAIQDQSTGRIYTDNVPVSVVQVSKDQEGNIVFKFEGKRVVSSDEFVKDFKRRLDVASMVKIAPIINTDNTVPDIAGDSIDL